MKNWDAGFLDAREAAALGDRRFSYVPFNELSLRDQAKARRMYPHKGVGAKYPFVDEHYFYPVVANGELGMSRRVLAIPYRLIQDEQYMRSLGYEVNSEWKDRMSSRMAASDDWAYYAAELADAMDEAAEGITGGRGPDFKGMKAMETMVRRFREEAQKVDDGSALGTARARESWRVLGDARAAVADVEASRAEFIEAQARMESEMRDAARDMRRAAEQLRGEL